MQQSRDHLMGAILIAATDHRGHVIPVEDRSTRRSCPRHDAGRHEMGACPAREHAGCSRSAYRLITAMATDGNNQAMSCRDLGRRSLRPPADTARERIELVWTGPTTPFVATLRTEQVLLDLIHHAQRDLFLVSFVAYDVSSWSDALNTATNRGIDIRILLWRPPRAMAGACPSILVLRCGAVFLRRHCMSGATDAHPSLKDEFTRKRLYADGKSAFLTSANLTGHALEKTGSWRRDPWGARSGEGPSRTSSLRYNRDQK